MLSSLSSVAFIVFQVAKGLFIGSLVLVAITSLVGGLSLLVFHSVIGEFFALVSLCLPFSAGSVFASFAFSISTILAGLVAYKVYNLFHLSNI